MDRVLKTEKKLISPLLAETLSRDRRKGIPCGPCTVSLPVLRHSLHYQLVRHGGLRVSPAPKVTYLSPFLEIYWGRIALLLHRNARDGAGIGLVHHHIRIAPWRHLSDEIQSRPEVLDHLGWETSHDVSMSDQTSLSQLTKSSVGLFRRDSLSEKP